MSILPLAFSRAARTALAASALCVLSSCSDTLAPLTGAGSGSVRVTGDVTMSGSGLSMFASDTSYGANAVQLAIAPPTPTANGVWTLGITFFEGRPAVGTYPLEVWGEPNPAAEFYYAANDTTRAFHATSGEVVITSSSPSRLEGTFSFQGNPPGWADTVHVEGEFSARCAPGTVCP